jgi:hypothetical protein
MTENPTPMPPDPSTNMPENQPVETEEREPETPLEKFMYHQRKGFEESIKAFEELLPPGFREHSAEARDHFLRSFQAITEIITGEVQKRAQGDEGITADDEDDDRPSTTGKSKVKVQVD